MCWAGSVERRLDDCWPNADAGRKQCQIFMCSGRSDTEELGCAGISTWAHRAYTGVVLDRLANVARYRMHEFQMNGLLCADVPLRNYSLTRMNEWTYEWITGNSADIERVLGVRMWNSFNTKSRCSHHSIHLNCHHVLSFHSCTVHTVSSSSSSSRTEQNRFGRTIGRNREVYHFGRKTEFTILDGIWMKSGQMTDCSLEQIVKIALNIIVTNCSSKNNNNNSAELPNTFLQSYFKFFVW